MEESDLINLFRLDSDPEVRAFFPDGILNSTQIKEKISKNRDSFEKNGFSDFILENKETGEFLGRGGFGITDNEIEMGYVLLKEFWGQGYAAEAAKALIDWGLKNLPLENFGQRIIAMAPINHTASHKVMEKCGMVYYKTDKYKGVDCKFYEIKK
jgi:RimJ/RimL family protein N-acetyltransferase